MRFIVASEFAGHCSAGFYASAFQGCNGRPELTLCESRKSGGKLAHSEKSAIEKDGFPEALEDHIPFEETFAPG